MFSCPVFGSVFWCCFFIGFFVFFNPLYASSHSCFRFFIFLFSGRSQYGIFWQTEHCYCAILLLQIHHYEHTFARLQCRSEFGCWPSPGIWPSSAGQCACTGSGCRGNESIQDGGAVLSVSFICTIHAAFQDTNWHYWHILSPQSVSRIISLPLACTVVWHQTNHSQGTGYKSGPCGKGQ